VSGRKVRQVKRWCTYGMAYAFYLPTTSYWARTGSFLAFFQWLVGCVIVIATLRSLIAVVRRYWYDV